MYLLVIFLPLISTFITGFGGRWVGYYGASIFSTSVIFICLIFSTLIFFEIGLSNTFILIKISPWINSGLLNVNWSFLFDSLTSVMLIVVTSVSFLVHFYSIGYMEEDPHFPRFMAYLSVFTFFMLILVTSDNIIQMFIGWEGVGIASYLLINFWFTRLAANQSALKALITNRVGDFGLSLAILVIFSIFKSLDYLLIFSTAPLFENAQITFYNLVINVYTVAGFFLFLGAIGKSAQLGLHVWLPDAMEGPTPVSALIHAATMVTAGVFLIIRFSPLIEFSPVTLTLLILFGSLTAFFAAVTGAFQHDLKKIIAYSTCSQLGYMMFACGLSHYNISLFHLTNHAFFKALLFLSAGAIIHSFSDEQDLRKMGSFVHFLPFTYSAMLIGSLALAGFPFLTGFYSKDLILELSQVYRNLNIGLNITSLVCWLGNLAVVFTAFYSFRLIYFTFFNSTNSSRYFFNKIHESSIFILLPLFFLVIGSIFFGYYAKDFFVGFGVNSWNTTIFIFPKNYNIIESEFLPCLTKWTPFFLSLLGALIATILNFKKLKIQLNFFAFLANKKWFWDTIFNRFLVYPILSFGFKITFQTLDRGFIELVGPYGITNLAQQLAQQLKIIQSGQLTHYLFFIITSLFLMTNNFLNLNLLFFFSILIFFM
uniref:NADH dehydrogenase subunit 5 n=1 Tax=Antithamnionella miharai TaxID=536589 RepID=UPI002E773EDE|nr:NADH dehydrogenase subunit 5 [Antithamnionella miharai]WQF69345.1 NADH dehydrogenase subunit 5 [Antithamnionella miharai]WQF69370.1 NADH dehydrogenase subunit 5 [Antithamnionella miharai]